VTRDEQILSLWPLARRLAARLAPTWLYQDAVSEAMLGALQAVDSYQPDRGATLNTWAYTRMYGAILDYLRRLSPSRRRGLDDEPAYPIKLLSIDCLIEGNDELIVGILPQELAADPRAEMDRGIEARERLARLPEKTRHIVEARFWREETCARIGRREGLSESRVSQILHDLHRDDRYSLRRARQKRAA
jgi:RNA polymerase sigma factor for flagellar operon FliA